MSELNIKINELRTLKKSYSDLADKVLPTSALLTELENGKQEMVDALAMKKVQSSIDKTLSAIADDVRSIAQSYTTIDGGEMYTTNMLFGSMRHNILEVAASIKNNYISREYMAAVIATYPKDKNDLNLSFYGGEYVACITSDGDFYANDGEHTPIGIHTWHDNDDKVDRYVVFLYISDNFTFQSLNSGYCPSALAIIGTCELLNVDYNNLEQLYVLKQFGELKKMTSGTNSPSGKWQGVVILDNIKEIKDCEFFVNLPTSATYLEIIELERLENAKLIRKGANGLKGLRADKLKEMNNSYFVYASNDQNALQSLSSISLPNLEVAINSSVYVSINSNGYKLNSLYLPKLKTIKIGIMNRHLIDSYTATIPMQELHLPSLEEASFSGSNTSLIYGNGLKRLYIDSIEAMYGRLSHAALKTLNYIYIGYKTNDKSKSVSIDYYENNTSCTDIELKEGYCKKLTISKFQGLTEENMINHILKRLKQDEEMCGSGVTITLGATNLAKLTSEEAVALLDSLTNTYGYTFA